MRRKRKSGNKFSISSPNIYTVHTHFILGMLVHKFYAERLGVVVGEIITIKGCDILNIDNVLVSIVKLSDISFELSPCEVTAV